MRIFVTGATGYVGSLVGPRLLADGHEPVVLVHRTRPSWAMDQHGATLVEGSVTSGAGLADAIDGCDAVVHLVGILREGRGRRFQDVHVDGTRNVLEAAEAADVRRYVHMSANGADRGIDTGYMRTKEQAEVLVRRSTLDWTMVRPSFVLGPGGDMQRLLSSLVATRLAPVIGGGRYPVAPIDGRDLAAAISLAVSSPKAVGRTYALCGPEAVEFRELLRRTARARGHGVALAPVPRWAALAMAATLGRIHLFPAEPDMLRMLMAGNACHEDRWASELGIEPRSLDEALAFMLGRAAP